MKKICLILVVFFVGDRLFAQPWNIEKEFPIVFLHSEDTNFIYQKSSNGSDCLIEGYSRTEPPKKVFDYTFDRVTKKKNGLFNLFDKKGKWYCSMLFKNGVLEELLLKSLDSTFSKYKIINNAFNGVYTAYFPNGKIKEYGFYKDNARIGEWIFYHDNGKISSTGSYLGNYVRLTYDYKVGNLISVNKFFDTISVEKVM